MQTRLYRVPEVAELLGVGRSTIYSILKSGDLKSMRVAGCRRVASNDLEDYLNALRTSGV